MSTQERLIGALQEKFPNESQAGLARIAGLSAPRFNNYCTGIRTMDVDAVIGCAQALGWDVRKAVADHLQETAHSPREKALWRKFAATAAGIALALGLLPSPEAHAAMVQESSAKPAYALCEKAKGAAAKLLRDLWTWLASCLPRLRPLKDTEIEA